MTVNQSDCAVLDINTYNKLKSSEVKANLVINQIFAMAEVKMDVTGDLELFVPYEDLSDLLLLAYPQRCKNMFNSYGNEEVSESDDDGNSL